MRYIRFAKRHTEAKIIISARITKAIVGCFVKKIGGRFEKAIGGYFQEPSGAFKISVDKSEKR